MRALALPLLVALGVACAGAGFTQEPPPSADRLLTDARAASYRIRTGQYELAAPSVAALEAGVKAYPKDVRLWNALGVAYFQQMTAAMGAGAFRELPGLVGKARDVHAQALALAPDDPEALSGHGTALTIISRFTNRPDLGNEGLAEMDRAVALAPNLTVIRLQRGFTHLGVPAKMRNPQTAEADLVHLIRLSEGRQPGDVLHVLLGDLYLDAGRAAEAKAQYAAAARAASPVRALGQGRLDALAAGTPFPAEAAKLRSDIARNCAMCHAS